MQRKAIVLLSGGLDSATALAVTLREGFEAYAMSFRYGQRHAVELDAARRLACCPGVVDHRVVDIDLRAFGGSALTSDVEVPKSGPTPGIPVTYVPARNTVFLAFALAWAEVLDADRIVIGANVVDYSGYPDCRPEYLAAFETAARLGTKAGRIEIHAPLVRMSKAEIISLGRELGVDFSEMSSCYDPTASGACGRCDSCRIRRDGFQAAGIADPTRYAA